jgi:group I intron endonuclease
MTIYKITNTVNDKLYIGVTSLDLNVRFSKHKTDAKYYRYVSKLHRAFRKYGADKFSIEAIDTASSLQELSNKEREWIKKLNTVETGYNINEGGINVLSDSFSEYWKNLSEVEKEAHRSKISQSRQGTRTGRGSGRFIGVFRQGNRWICQVTIRQQKFVKSFATEEEAAEAYDKLVIREFGPSAKTNFGKTYSQIELESFFAFFQKPAIVQRRYPRKYKGVVFNKRRNKWIARIYQNGKAVWSSQFPTEDEAYHNQQIKILELGIGHRASLSL